MEKHPDFWSVVIGPGPLGVYFGLIVVALITAAVSLLIESSSRNVMSARTPVKFSWQFLLAANWKRIIANFLAVPVLIRLSYPSLNQESMLLVAVGIGAIIDRTALWLRKIGILSSQKAEDSMKAKLVAVAPAITEPAPI